MDRPRRPVQMLAVGVEGEDGVGLHHHEQIEALRKIGPRRSERLPQQSLEAMPRHRVANATAHGETETAEFAAVRTPKEQERSASPSHLCGEDGIEGTAAMEPQRASEPMRARRGGTHASSPSCVW